VSDKGRKRKDEFNDIFIDICEEASQCSSRFSHREYSVRDALKEVGWMPPKRNELDACVEWMVVDFEFGENAAATSFNKNITGELSREHFGHREWLVSDKRGFD
jgi:hypothetical protein